MLDRDMRKGISLRPNRLKMRKSKSHQPENQTMAYPEIATVDNIREELEAKSDPSRAAILQKYFKTGRGEYAEGDIFLGVRVPEVRKIASKYRNLELNAVCELLTSPIHEERFLALVIMVKQFSQVGGADGADGTKMVEGVVGTQGTETADGADGASRRHYYETYMAHLEYINHWDLVDTSAMHIPGAYLFDRARDPLYELAGSDHLWSRRVAIVSTYYFIKRDDFEDTLALAEMLLHDPHDLMHKAVGWMLREVGKRDHAVEEEFLTRTYREMPRTMLRYAIEKFPEELRQAYLKGRV